MRSTAAIVGIPGPELDQPTTDLLRARRPAGVILFGRNVLNPAQLMALTAALRAVLPQDAVIMVDQEGGRVARLRPPSWRRHPAAGSIGALHAAQPERGLRAAWLTGALIGFECAEAGFDVVCAPVLDRRLPGFHDIVGDRGTSDDPHVVAELGRAMADGLLAAGIQLLAAGIQPVMKHLPGHGRARVDSHLSLPVVRDEEQDDLLPFTVNADLPWGMTAHILYPALDRHHPATLSAEIVERVIRGAIGFGGVLVSDDLAMGALSGLPAERAVAALDAGCDVAMYCAGDAEGTEAVLAACPPLSRAAAARMAAARAMARDRRIDLNPAAMAAERDTLLP